MAVGHASWRIVVAAHVNLVVLAGQRIGRLHGRGCESREPVPIGHLRCPTFANMRAQVARTAGQTQDHPPSSLLSHTSVMIDGRFSAARTCHTMPVLASILPGLREIRTPLIVGYSWMVVFYFAF